jgi:hypothetical protein
VQDVSTTIVVRVTVVAEDDTASDEAACRLLDELHELDNIISVEQASQPGAPAGARSGELLAIGTLVLTLAAQPDVITAVLTSVANWSRRQRRGRVEFRLGDAELIITNATDAQTDKLISTFVEEVSDPDS